MPEPTRAPLLHDQEQAHTEALRKAGFLPEIPWAVKVLLSLRRKMTVGLNRQETSVELRIPPGAISRSVVDAALRREEQLRAQWAERRPTPARPASKLLADGEPFLWLGTPYRLRIVDGVAEAHHYLTGEGPVLEVGRDPIISGGAAPIVRWYTRQGSAWARQRLEEHWLPKAGLTSKPPSLSVERLSAKFGQYEDLAHHITVDWPVFQYEEHLVDTVLAHEVAHATRPPGDTHGPFFKMRLSQLQPNWEEQETEMRRRRTEMWAGRVRRPASLRPARSK